MKHTLRSRLIFSLLMLIGAAFAGVIIVFNISVQRYIDANARQELKRAYEMLTADSYIVRGPRLMQQEWDEGFNSRPRNPIGAEVEFFTWNSDGDIVITGRDKDPELALKIAEALDPEAARQQVETVRTEDGVYLAGALDGRQAGEYVILFVDITAMETFAQNINLQLLIIMAVVGAAAVAVAFALAASVSKPVEQMVAFATKIGENDFTPSSLTFRDRELNDLLGAMNVTARRLADYDSEQKTFFQNVSHELKTPLMTIRCNAEGIAFEVMEPPAAAQTIMAETDRLGSLVDDILYVSKMDTITETEVLEECDLREVLSNCAENQKAAAENRGVQFVYDFSEEPVMRNVSEKSIQRAFSNLISNAIRYADSEIVLTCRDRGGTAVVDIWNDGPPIAEADLPHVFERFFKGAGGQSGIGLSIVRSVVGKLGGTVAAQSGSGGTSFTIELP